MLASFSFLFSLFRFVSFRIFFGISFSQIFLLSFGKEVFDPLTFLPFVYHEQHLDMLCRTQNKLGLICFLTDQRHDTNSLQFDTTKIYISNDSALRTIN